MEVGSKNRKSRKREVLDFVLLLPPPPLLAPTKDAALPDFRISPTFRPSVSPRRRKLSFNFPRNSNKVGRPSRVLGPGRVHAAPPPSPANILNSHFTGLWDVTLSAPERRQKQPRFRVWSPGHGTTVHHQNEIPMPMPDLKRKKSFCSTQGRPPELPTTVLGVLSFSLPCCWARPFIQISRREIFRSLIYW